MTTELLSKVKKQFEEIDYLLKETLKQDFLPDRTYTHIVTKLGIIESNYLRDELRSTDPNYFNWAKIRLEKMSTLLVALKKHMSANFSLTKEDLLHVTGDYYNEDNSITLTSEAKQKISDLLKEAYTS